MDVVKLEKDEYSDQTCFYSVAKVLSNFEQFGAPKAHSINFVKEELDDSSDPNGYKFSRESGGECTRTLKDSKSLTQCSLDDSEEISNEGIVCSSDKYWTSKDHFECRHNDRESNQSCVFIKQEFNHTDGTFLEGVGCEGPNNSEEVLEDEGKICSGDDSLFSINCRHDPTKREQVEGPNTEDFSEARVTSKAVKKKNPPKRQERRLKINYCKFCDFSTNHATSLKNHINAIHLQQKDFKCNFCDFSTLQKVVLKEHIDAIHFHLKLHKCTMCDFSTARSNYLKHHVNGVHLQRKQHKCDMCDFSTTQSHNLKIHIDDVHFQLRNLKCQSCKFSTSKRADLKRHVDAVHLRMKNLKCAYCDYATLRQYNLNCHVKNKHFMLSNQEPEPKCHKCESCDYSTSKRADLARHIAAVHLKIRDLKCHLCEYATQRSFNLKCHLRRIHFKAKKAVAEPTNQEALKSGSSEVS